MTIPLFSENGKGENQIFLEFFCFSPASPDNYSFLRFSGIIPENSAMVHRFPANAGEDIILPPGRLTECSDEWYHAGRGADSPNISNQIGPYRAGGIIASPTVAGQFCYMIPFIAMRRNKHRPGNCFALNFPKQTVAFLWEIRYNNRNMKGGVAPVSFSIR